jgi:ureidoacrylate peracid hydrolase
MHKFALPPHVLDNIEKRRGGRHHIYETLDPAKTALIVIDMQNYFVATGMAGEVPMARAIVPNINRLAAATRAAGGRVAWVINNFPDDICESWSVMMMDVFSPERREAMLEHLREGGEGHPQWPELITEPEDWQLYKNRFSAFIQGSSDIEARLRAEGRDTVIITGTLTNVCCESSARDAMMRNFKTVMVSDANAALTDEDHNYSLGALVQVFADVMSTDEVIARLTAGEAAAAE